MSPGGCGAAAAGPLCCGVLVPGHGPKSGHRGNQFPLREVEIIVTVGLIQGAIRETAILPSSRSEDCLCSQNHSCLKKLLDIEFAVFH